MYGIVHDMREVLYYVERRMRSILCVLSASIPSPFMLSVSLYFDDILYICECCVH